MICELVNVRDADDIVIELTSSGKLRVIKYRDEDGASKLYNVTEIVVRKECLLRSEVGNHTIRLYLQSDDSYLVTTASKTSEECPWMRPTMDLDVAEKKLAELTSTLLLA